MSSLFVNQHVLDLCTRERFYVPVIMPLFNFVLHIFKLNLRHMISLRLRDGNIR
jgi:hypothetical protein